MFTGIIEEIGTVQNFYKTGNQAVITVGCSKVLDGTVIGDSISVNGVCQTVVEMTSTGFTANVSEETIKVTNFSKLKSGDFVNLERALTLNARLGGHIVQGHIEGVVVLKNIVKDSGFYNFKFFADKNLSKYIVKKGSVALNGVSLTVAEVLDNEFSVAVIPHTFENTVLKYLKVGENLNLETDILAKYVEKFLSTDNNRNIDENFLKENGFF